jgi:hypothetical protein
MNLLTLIIDFYSIRDCFAIYGIKLQRTGILKKKCNKSVINNL